jgi:di/tripeptidase
VRDVNRGGKQFVRATLEVIGERPPGEIPADHALVRLAVSCLEAQGYPARLNIGSTDANVPLSRGLPAICLGMSVGGGAHTSDEYILTRPLGHGLAQLVDVVRGAFRHI